MIDVIPRAIKAHSFRTPVSLRDFCAPEDAKCNLVITSANLTPGWTILERLVAPLFDGVAGWVEGAVVRFLRK